MSVFLDTLLANAGNEAFDDLPEVVVPPVVEPVVPEVPAVPEIPVVAEVSVVDVVPVVPEVPMVPVVEVVPVVETPEPVVTPDPVDVAAVNAAAVLVAEAEADLEIANGRVALAVLDSELATSERDIADTTGAIEHIQEVSAGIEHFMEVGSISASTAMLLQQSVNSAMRRVNKDGREMMQGGLEHFGDSPDQAMILLGAGLLELEEEGKASKGRVMKALKGALATISKFVAEALNQSKRLRGRAAELQTAISGKPEKDVTLNVAALLVSKNYSTNLVADLTKFKDKLIKASSEAISTRANWYFKTAPGIVETINGAETPEAAVSAAAKFQPPALKGATVSVSDGLKRTEVVLGNYAIFEMTTAAAAPTDAASAVEFLNAAAKSRISIQRAKIQAPEAETLSMNEATAAKVITACLAILDEAESLKGVVDSLVKSVPDLDINAVDAAKEVRKIAQAANRSPDGLVDTVSQLPRTATRAAFDVVEAALAVVSSFAKGAKAEKAEKAEKPDAKADKDNKDDKGDEE